MSEHSERPKSKIFFPKVAAPSLPSVEEQTTSNTTTVTTELEALAPTADSQSPSSLSSTSSPQRPSSGETSSSLKHSPSASSLSSSQYDDPEESETEKEDEDEDEGITEGEEEEEPEDGLTPSPTSGVLSPLASLETMVAIRCNKCKKEGHWSADCTVGDEEHVTVDVVYVTHRGKMMIKSATLEKLVEGLYTESKGTQEFITEYVDIFLLTFRTFISAKDVFTMIVKTYQDCAKEHDTDTKAKRLRIGNFLKRWVENHFYDFETNDDLLLSYRRFLDHMQGMGVDQTMISALRKAIDKGV